VARASGLVLRRALSQRLIVAAAFGTILLATTVLSALLLYATTVTDNGVQRSLATAPIDQVGSRITAPVTPQTHSAIDSQVRSAASEAYAHAGIQVVETARSESYALPGQEDRGDNAELTTFAMYEGIDHHSVLASGRWPAPVSADASAVEAAFPVATADAAGLSAGETVTLVNRLDHKPLRVTVTGLYRPNDQQDPFWRADPLAESGVQRLAFTTYGPLIVPQQTFLSRFAADVITTWQVLPDLSGVSTSQVRELADAGNVLEERLQANQLGSRASVSTKLPELARQLDRAAVVARSTMLIPVLQLVVLAGYALFLTARLISEHRRAELALLQARGADGGQLTALSLREGLLLAAPAALIAPLLAIPLLKLVNASPTVRAAGLTIQTRLTVSSWGVAVVAAALSALAVTVPTLRGLGKTYVESQQARGRGEKRSIAQQAGADLAILAIAVLGFWQLRRYGGPVTTTVSRTEVGGLGIDPFIVAGPAIGLVAGGVLALRLVPLMSGAAERVTSRGPGLAPALGAWQVSRRPLRYAGPALLLVMAVAVGVLSLSTSATWRKSQNDQADLAAGSDLRVTGKTGITTLSALGQAGTYAGLPGVATISPAYRLSGTVGSRTAEILGLDATKLADLVTLRPDLEPRGGLADAAAAMAAERLPLRPVTLPGHPTRLGIAALAMPEGGSYDGRHAVDVGVLLRDALGARYVLRAGTVPGDGKPHELDIDLAAVAGSDGRLAYPLAFEGFGLGYSAAADGHIEPLRVTVDRFEAAEQGSSPAPIRSTDDRWLPAPGVRPQPGNGHSLVAARLSMPDPRAVGAPTLTGGLSTASMQTYLLLGDASRVKILAGGEQSGLSRSPAGYSGLRGLVTPDLLKATNTTVGSDLTLSVQGRTLPVHVAGVIGALPGTAAGQDGVLLDANTLTADRLVTAGQVDQVSEWWIATADHDTAAASAALRTNRNLADAVVDRQDLRRAMRDDPLGSGLQGALFLGFLAALAFAAIGFAVNAAVSARERLTEFGLMRALGISSRQIFGLLGVEQAFLVALGVLGGVALGAIVARLVVPHIVLTAQATTVSPPVIMSTPWLLILILAGAVVGLLGFIVAVLGASLRRAGLGATLRIGEDR
jgi:ABC-type lipoprotein release transport system permease subunit